MDIVGTITFGNRLLNVYQSANEPLFKASDVADLIDYSGGNIWHMLEMCEEDEKLILPVVIAGQNRNATFLTENGLYDVLSQSRKPVARAWRRIAHNELIRLRHERGKNIVEQFDDWNHELDDLYFDEDGNMWMKSVTVPGGDVVQIPYEEKI